MFELLPMLGEIYLEEKGIDEFQSFLQNPKADYYISIKLYTEGSSKVKIISTEIESSPYDYEKLKNKIFFRQPPNNGPGTLPISILNTDNPKKTLIGKIQAWFKNAKKLKPSDPKILSLIEEAEDYLMKEKDTIISRINEQIEDIKNDFKRRKETGEVLPQNPRILLTVDFDPDSISNAFRKFLKEILSEEVKKKYYGKKFKSLGEGVCYYCGKEGEVFGLAFPFKFYTHDKINFAQELEVNKSWHQFPVCFNCAVLAENGRYYVEEKLHFKLQGVDYLLFPQVFHKENLEELLSYLMDSYTEKVERNARQETRVITLKNNLTGDEEELLENIKDLEDYLMVTFLFYRVNKAQEEILALVPDVLPSRLSELYNAKDKIDSEPFLSELWARVSKTKDKPPESLRFTFKFVRDLYPSSLANEKSRKDLFINQFLALVSAALTKSPIDQEVIISQGIRNLRHIFSNRGKPWYYLFKIYALEYLLVLLYYDLIGCLKRDENTLQGVENMNDEEILKQLKLEDNRIIDLVMKFFNTNKYFDSPAKKGAFLAGMLARRVTYEQYKSLKSEPFYEKLYSLRLDLRKVRRLVTESMAKLREYNSPQNKALTNNVKAIEALATYFLSQTSPNEKITNDDISFSFATGLALGTSLFVKAGEKIEKENEE